MRRNNTLVTMPTIGFGTYLIPDEDAPRTINSAIKSGYRHIDTAEVYRNETGIGLGLKDSFTQFFLKRALLRAAIKTIESWDLISWCSSSFFFMQN